MSNNNDDRPEWADPPTDELQTDDSSVTTNTTPPEKRYDCPHCDASFSGDSALKKRAEHIADAHPDETAASSDGDSSSNTDGPTREALSGIAGLVGGLSDKETGSYHGWLSTSAEVGVFLFGIALGSLLAHGAISVEVLAALGGLGLVGAGAAARNDNAESRDGIQSNIEHYVVGILIGFMVVFLPHEVLPEGWSVDDLLHLFGRHSH